MKKADPSYSYYGYIIIKRYTSFCLYYVYFQVNYPLYNTIFTNKKAKMTKDVLDKIFLTINTLIVIAFELQFL